MTDTGRILKPVYTTANDKTRVNTSNPMAITKRDTGRILKPKSNTANDKPWVNSQTHGISLINDKGQP